MESLIKQNLEVCRNSIPREKDVEIVAVSKFQPIEAIQEAYKAGQRVFGESRVQELIEKARVLPSDIQWHFIGHLQTNKISQLLTVPNLKLIQSVDSIRLLSLIDSEAVKAGRTIHVLLELHVAREETKFGFSPEDLEQWFADRGFEALRAVHIDGLMGMATNTDDEEIVRNDFKAIASSFHNIKTNVSDLRGFDKLSMGMSGDYLIAVDEGANIVRIGTSIFGSRY